MYVMGLVIYGVTYQHFAFYATLAGLVPRVSVPCIVHPANEVTPYTTD